MPVFDKPLKLIAPFDPERAGRTIGELETLAPDLMGVEPFHALIGSAAGNSPYLARLMLKDQAWSLGSTRCRTREQIGSSRSPRAALALAGRSDR